MKKKFEKSKKVNITLKNFSWSVQKFTNLKSKNAYTLLRTGKFFIQKLWKRALEDSKQSSRKTEWALKDRKRILTRRERK